MAELPSGTVTFLFTDLEGSTRRWEEQPEAMRAALAAHDTLLREAIEGQSGHVVKSTGDGVFAVFADPSAAVAAAVDAQQALGADAAQDGALRVRMGLHVGSATVQDGDCVGTEVNRTARLMSIAHGGQIVCSRPVRDLVGDRFTLTDLGEHRLRDLSSSVHVFQVEAPGLASDFPPLRSLTAGSGNLPRQMTTFVGRAEEVDAVAALVRESALVTLTGVGGVGKTRLALQVAADLSADYRDGAWLCELAPLTNADAVWDVLASSLRVPMVPGRSPEEATLDYLAAKRLLLVVDNCEHLVVTVARVAAAVAQRAPEVSVLATSREGLAVAGERIVAVPVLDVPGADTGTETIMAADAVRLFADRATAAKHDFVLDDRNADAVGTLCRRLDGIPLAIELAAARVRSLSPEDLVARLDQRFQLLTKGSRAALERHQTLRSTIDWSYDLLEPAERQALDRLSVFAGSCDLAAAEAVLAGGELDELDVVDVLDQLVDKSLVVADDHADGGVRYRLLESIRQYGAERLEAEGETAAVRRRHADHYVAVAEAAGPHLRNRDQVEWSRSVLRDVDNFRSVVEWAVESASPDHALRLVGPFSVTGMVIGDVALDWAETAVAIDGADRHLLYPPVAGFASLGATFAGDLERAEVRAEAALSAQARWGASTPSVERALSMLMLYRAEFAGAQAHAQAWVELARASDDCCDLADALVMLNGSFFDEPERARPIAEEAIRVARDAGILSALSFALAQLAGYLPIEESARALALLDEAADASVQVGNNLSLSTAMVTRSLIALRCGAWPAALAAAVQLARRQIEFGQIVSLFSSMDSALIALWGLDRPEAAAVLLGKSRTLEGRVHPDWMTVLLAEVEASLRQNSGAGRFAELTAEGATLDNAAAVAFLAEQSALALDEG